MKAKVHQKQPVNVDTRAQVAERMDGEELA